MGGDVPSLYLWQLRKFLSPQTPPVGDTDQHLMERGPLDHY